MSFTDNTSKNRFEYAINDAVVIANYRKDGGVLYIDYVEAPEVLRGTGAAGKIMKEIMDAARKDGLKVVPVCGYAATWIQRHGEYADILG